jgi:hypothetical protein
LEILWILRHSETFWDILSLCPATNGRRTAVLAASCLGRQRLGPWRWCRGCHVLRLPPGHISMKLSRRIKNQKNNEVNNDHRLIIGYHGFK